LTKTQDIARVNRATYEEFERLRMDIESVERQGDMTTNFYTHMSKGVLEALDYEVKQLFIEQHTEEDFFKHCW
jgi:hypothetical protein